MGECTEYEVIIDENTLSHIPIMKRQKQELKSLILRRSQRWGCSATVGLGILLLCMMPKILA